MKCDVCGKEMTWTLHSGSEERPCVACGKPLCAACAKRISNDDKRCEPDSLCPTHYKQVKDFIEGLKPKRNEPLTWRVVPHGSRPSNSTFIGRLFDCDVWYDPDIVQKAWNEWRENHVEPYQPEVVVERIHDGYRIDAGIFTSHGGSPRSEGSISEEAANALYDHIKRERGENA